MELVSVIVLPVMTAFNLLLPSRARNSRPRFALAVVTVLLVTSRSIVPAPLVISRIPGPTPSEGTETEFAFINPLKEVAAVELPPRLILMGEAGVSRVLVLRVAF